MVPYWFLVDNVCSLWAVYVGASPTSIDLVPGGGDIKHRACRSSHVACAGAVTGARTSHGDTRTPPFLRPDLCPLSPIPPSRPLTQPRSAIAALSDQIMGDSWSIIHQRSSMPGCAGAVERDVSSSRDQLIAANLLSTLTPC